MKLIYKNILVLFLIFFSFATVLHAEKYNDNIQYEEKNKIVYISGDGAIQISDNTAFSDTISSSIGIEFANSITEIPSYFALSESLTYALIPSSVVNIGSYSVGYYSDNSEYKQVSGFTIKGEKGSAAEKYASDNGFTFVESYYITDPEYQTGEITSNIKWKLDKSGILYIEGNGKIPDYNDGSDVPWKIFYSEKEGFKISSLYICEGITYIGKNSFSFENEIDTVIFSDSVLEIGDYAFTGCQNLSNINFNNVELVGNYAFYGLSSITSIKGEKISFIKSYAFSNSSISSAEFSRLLTELPQGMFKGCSVLTEIIAPGVEKIGDEAFNGCNELSIISFGKIKSIGNYSFFDCKNLSDFTFSSSISYIGEFAFSYSGLKNISFNANISALPRGIFEGCNKLASLSLAKNIKEIHERALTSCGELKTISLSENIKYIEPYSVGYYYFKDDNLEKTYSKYSVFEFTIYGPEPSIVKKYAEDNEFLFMSTGFITNASGDINENVSWNLNLNTGSLKIKGSGKIDDFTSISEVPWLIYSDYILSVSFEGTKNIPSYSCDGMKLITSISISNSVTSIGDFAFRGTNIESITFPKSLDSIGESAFENCQKIQQISFPSSLDNIGSNAFKGIPLVQSVYIPDNVSYIGDKAIGYDSNGYLINGFLIKGSDDTTAQYYARENSITYRIDGYITVKDQNSNAYIVMLGNDDEYTFTLEHLGTTLEPDLFISHSDYIDVYKPSLYISGASINIDGVATIYIPVSNSQNQLFSKIYIMYDYGSFDLIEVEVSNGYYVVNTSSLNNIIITNAQLENLSKICVEYMSESGSQLIDNRTIYCTLNTDFNIDSAEINGYSCNEQSIKGKTSQNVEEIKVQFIYTKYAETTVLETEPIIIPKEKDDFLSVLSIIEIILIVVLVLSLILIIYLMIKKKNIDEAIEKSDKMIEKSKASEKYADTMIADISEKNPNLLDISSLFNEEEPEINVKKIDGAVKKHFKIQKKPNPKRKI